MNQTTKGSKNIKLTCEICKIEFNTEAENALHEFSKKHCDNLIKLSKNKSVVVKQKTKKHVLQTEKETSKPNIVTQTGSFAMYGYFIPGEIYMPSNISKAYNTDYDSYVQKLGDSHQHTPVISDGSEYKTCVTNAHTSLSNRKKKKSKTCEICNITLMTAPEYASHMTSSQHIEQLKISGRGVSAHFVKASVNLNTTEIDKEVKLNQTCQEQTPDDQVLLTGTLSGGIFPPLFCDVCSLLLNSPDQYNAHVAGQSHLECVQRKAELKAKKKKQQNPTSHELYCYSCKISLNNLSQYNEHKNGKKHKMKCRQLIKEGITIPPEERLPGWIMPKADPNKPIIYPELYEKFILEKEVKVDDEYTSSDMVENITVKRVRVEQNITNHVPSTDTFSGDMLHKEINCNSDNLNDISCKECINKSLTSSKSCNFSPANPDSDINSLHHDSSTHQINTCLDDSSKLTLSCSEKSDKQLFQLVTERNVPDTNTAGKEEVIVLGNNEFLKCHICNVNFACHLEFDSHLITEDHNKGILQLKENGRTDTQILEMMISTQNVVKPDTLDRYICSLCNITASSVDEYKKHLNSILHKHTLNNYKQKKLIEIRHAVKVNDKGFYPCRLCKEEFKSLLEFCQHLHLMKHKNNERIEKTRKLSAKRKFDFRVNQMLKRNFKRRREIIRNVKSPENRVEDISITATYFNVECEKMLNLQPEPQGDLLQNVKYDINTTNKNIFEDVMKSKHGERRRNSQRNLFHRFEGFGKVNTLYPIRCNSYSSPFGQRTPSWPTMSQCRSFPLNQVRTHEFYGQSNLTKCGFPQNRYMFDYNCKNLNQPWNQRRKLRSSFR